MKKAIADINNFISTNVFACMLWGDVSHAISLNIFYGPRSSCELKQISNSQDCNPSLLQLLKVPIQQTDTVLVTQNERRPESLHKHCSVMLCSAQKARLSAGPVMFHEHTEPVVTSPESLCILQLLSYHSLCSFQC